MNICFPGLGGEGELKPFNLDPSALPINCTFSLCVLNKKNLLIYGTVKSAKVI
jgi:hypothetical protein